MMPGLRARRRADEFHALVESHSTEGLEARAERFDADLALVGLMRSAAPEQPRPDFVSSLRAELMAEAAEVLSPTAARLTVRPRTASHERRLGVAVGGFAVVSAAMSMGAVAQDALPGDALYPLKRALENAGTTLQFNQDDRALSLLDRASDRLLEAEALVAGSEPDRVADTLHEFSDQAGSASDAIFDEFEATADDKTVQRLSDFATSSEVTLHQLQSAAPESARPALIEATQVIEQISRQISYLCPACEAAITPQSALAAPVTTHLLAGPERVSPVAKNARQQQTERTVADDEGPAADEGTDGGTAGIDDKAPAEQPTEQQPRTDLGKTVTSTTQQLTDTVDKLVKSVTGGSDESGLLSQTLATLGKTVDGLLGGGQ